MYRVLVVEDEPWIRKATVKMIENIGAGFEVVGEAENGEEAWSMIQTLWPSIVIADIMMPEKDGLALTEQIQARNFRLSQSLLVVLTIFNTRKGQFAMVLPNIC